MPEMYKKKVETMIACALVLVFMVTLAGSLRKVLGKLARSAQTRRAVTIPAQEAATVADTEQETAASRAASTEVLAWGRDPFVLGEITAEAGSVESLKLMGITTGRGNAPSKAIINDEIVSAGSTLGRFTVLAITPTSVTVTDGEKKYTLEMK